MFLGKQYCGGSGSSGGTDISLVPAPASAREGRRWTAVGTANEMAGARAAAINRKYLTPKAGEGPMTVKGVAF
jgi:hypothetical protein